MKWKKIYNDKIKRKLFKNLEIRLTSIKSLIKTQSLKNSNYKNILKKELFFYDNNSFLTKKNNMCIFTGRHSSVYRRFRISRIELRRSASKNDIFGLKKSSW